MDTDSSMISNNYEVTVNNTENQENQKNKWILKCVNQIAESPIQGYFN